MVLLLTGAAHADSAKGAPAHASVSVDRKAEADHLFKEAMRKSANKEDREEVLDLFEKSYGLDPIPLALYNMALFQSISKRHLQVEALRNMSFWLDIPDRNKSGDAQAKQTIEQMRRQTGHVTVAGGDVKTVTVDGKDAVAVGGVYYVLPGTRTVEAWTSTGHQSREIVIGPGDNVTVSLEETNTSSVAAPVSPSKDAVVATGPASPTGGDGSDAKGVTNRNAPLGSSTATTETKRDPEPRDGHHDALRMSVSGGLVVGAAILLIPGFVLKSSADSNANQAAESLSVSPTPSSGCIRGNASSACTSANDHTQAHGRDIGLSTASFIGAGVLAAAGVTLWFALPHDGAKATKEGAVRFQLSPAVSPNYAGASLYGHF